ncbi:MAG: M28 family peptidase [Verrucomicrobiota bacterium]|nr:M28 family peptidase [Verrucomicrobiota bacterium]
MKSHLRLLFAPLLLATALTKAETRSPISADRIKEDVKNLSSDEFLGRGPGEPGEEKAMAYLAEAFGKAGLEPAGENGGWFQDVPLVRLDRLPGATLTLRVRDKTIPLALGQNATLGLRNPDRTTITDAPLVFAGYGVVDAEHGWNAYEGVDMSGKVAVVLANDPDFEAGRDLGFEGRRLAYAGRVGVKFEMAAKAGAVGVIVIHEEAAASYPFSQLSSGDALPAMVAAPLNPSPLKFSSWLALDVAQDLLKRSKLTLAELKKRAQDPKFRAFPLEGTSISASGDLKATPFVSHNVIAKLTGTIKPNEFILYGAHYDANGQNGPDKTGDNIRNGAVDNATGTSEVLEIARAFKAGEPPARTVLLAAWTAEEKGLLGSDYYAGHPLYPLATTAAVINLDPHVVLPAARDLELIGVGRTTLEDDFARAASSVNLRVTPEPNPEAGWYFRSDHFPFARRGVPALAFRAGRDLVEGGTAAGQKIVSAYNKNCYHQPCDQFDPHWTFAGTAQEATVAYFLGRDLANSGAWPTWKEGIEFKKIREQTDAERTK